MKIISLRLLSSDAVGKWEKLADTGNDSNCLVLFKIVLQTTKMKHQIMIMVVFEVMPLQFRVTYLT